MGAPIAAQGLSDAAGGCAAGRYVARSPVEFPDVALHDPFQSTRLAYRRGDLFHRELFVCRPDVIAGSDPCLGEGV